VIIRLSEAASSHEKRLSEQAEAFEPRVRQRRMGNQQMRLPLRRRRHEKKMGRRPFIFSVVPAKAAAKAKEESYKVAPL
jgi:hypothetical protein